MTKILLVEDDKSIVLVDTEKGTVAKGSRDMYLTALEYRLLLVFINNRRVLLPVLNCWNPFGTLPECSSTTTR